MIFARNQISRPFKKIRGCKKKYTIVPVLDVGEEKEVIKLMSETRQNPKEEVESGEESEVESGEGREDGSGQESEVESGEEGEDGSGQESEAESGEEDEAESGEESEVESDEEDGKKVEIPLRDTVRSMIQKLENERERTLGKAEKILADTFDGITDALEVHRSVVRSVVGSARLDDAMDVSKEVPGISVGEYRPKDPLYLYTVIKLPVSAFDVVAENLMRAAERTKTSDAFVSVLGFVRKIDRARAAIESYHAIKAVQDIGIAAKKAMEEINDAIAGHIKRYAEMAIEGERMVLEDKIAKKKFEEDKMMMKVLAIPPVKLEATLPVMESVSSIMENAPPGMENVSPAVENAPSIAESVQVKAPGNN
jgi:hypothetical protein